MSSASAARRRELATCAAPRRRTAWRNPPGRRSPPSPSRSSCGCAGSARPSAGSNFHLLRADGDRRHALQGDRQLLADLLDQRDLRRALVGRRTSPPALSCPRGSRPRAASSTMIGCRSSVLRALLRFRERPRPRHAGERLRRRLEPQQAGTNASLASSMSPRRGLDHHRDGRSASREREQPRGDEVHRVLGLALRADVLQDREPPRRPCDASRRRRERRLHEAPMRPALLVTASGVANETRR